MTNQQKILPKKFSYQTIFRASIKILTLYILCHNSAFSTPKTAIDSTNDNTMSTEAHLEISFYLVVFEIEPEWKKAHDEVVFSSVMQNPEYSSIFQKHFAYMEKLSAKGDIFMGGPILNRLSIKNPLLDGAMFIYKANTKNEAEVFIQKDPLVINNIMRVESIRPFIRGV